MMPVPESDSEIDFQEAYNNFVSAVKVAHEALLSHGGGSDEFIAAHREENRLYAITRVMIARRQFRMKPGFDGQ